MVRIALFNPELKKSNKINLWQNNIKDDYIHPPLGLIALATSCIKAGHEAYVYDLAIEKNPQEKFEIALKEFQPDVVGLTAYTSNEAIALNYAKRCRELGIPVIIGGYAATFDWKTMLQSPGVNAVICGEGEVPLISLLKSWELGEDLENIPGLHLRGEITYTPAVRIENLDDLPKMNFNLIDMRPYVMKEAIGLVTSRGCPYNCYFCSCQKMWTRRVTRKSLENILSEIDNIIHSFNYEGKMITFFDDTFTLDRNRILSFCDELKKRNYKIFWKVMTRVDRVDPELLRIMFEAGCRHVAFGIDATTDEDLCRLNKGFSVEQAKRAVDYANRKGLVTEGYFIIGFPWQTREDLFNTVETIREFGVTIPKLSCLTPYPGTHFAEKLKDYGMRIPLEDHSRFDGLLPVIETDNFTLYDQAEAMLAFVDSYLLTNVRESFDASKETGEDLHTNEIEEITFSEIAKDDPFDELIKKGLIPQVSPFTAFREVEGGTLAYEYRVGSFALFNQSMVEIIKECYVNDKFDDLLLTLRQKFNFVNYNDLIEAFKLLRDFGFLVEE